MLNLGLIRIGCSSKLVVHGSLDEGKIEEAQSLLQQIKENMEVNNGRIDDSLLVRLYRDKITSKPALNQGYYFLSDILGSTLLAPVGTRVTRPVRLDKKI